MILKILALSLRRYVAMQNTRQPPMQEEYTEMRSPREKQMLQENYMSMSSPAPSQVFFVKEEK